jgi:hypothetical protein
MHAQHVRRGLSPQAYAHFFLYSALTVALLQAMPAWAVDEDLDALSLESASEGASESVRATQLFVEGALGHASQRYQLGGGALGRASLDITHSSRLAPGLRAVISNRLDVIDPVAPGADAAVNSLREAYVSWQPAAANTVLELGRINLRYGPAYGYNPTDFFRDGSLRTLTTVNPFALRENRLGTFMLRGQQLWSGGSLSVAYSPKLAGAANTDGLSLDWGATNHRNRVVVALGTQLSQNVNSQLLAYKEQGRSTTMGVNLTALLSDAAVAHVEWSRGKEPDLLSRALGTPAQGATRNRFAGGVTYTTLGKLSFTAEYQYNGFAAAQSEWQTLSATPLAQWAYLRESLRLLELAPRQAYLLYVTQKSLGLKNLDFTAFLRINAEDHSRLAWAELRHHWPSFDLTLQAQQYMGKPSTEFGLSPDRRVVQVLGTYYF